MQQRSVFYSAMACVVSLCLFVLAPAGAVQAQPLPHTPGRGWTPQAPIPGYSVEAMPPVLVPDSAGVVHAFTSMPMSDDLTDPASLEVAVYYSQWTQDGGWTEPVDILLTPIKFQARLKSVYLDPQGMFHLVFYGGDENEAYIFYSSAPLQLAGNAHAWSSPFPVGTKATAPEIADIVGNGNGDLIVVYAGDLGEGNSLYSVTSADGGGTWSEPHLLYSTYSRTTKPFDFQMYLGQSGVLHAVWNTTNDQGQNVDGLYARLPDITTNAWSTPISIAVPDGLGIAIPAVIEHEGKVFLVFNNGNTNRAEGIAFAMQWFRQSDDLGITWTEPITPWSTHIGRNGQTEFLVDSDNRLHVFFGERIPLGGDLSDIHGMWGSVWTGSTWGPLQPVVTGLISDSFGPYDARGAISLGNTVLLTWRTDPGMKVSSTWYSVSVLDTPPIAPVPTPVLAGSFVPDSVLLSSAADGDRQKEDGPVLHLDDLVGSDLQAAPAAPDATAAAEAEQPQAPLAVANAPQLLPEGPGLPIAVGFATSLLFTFIGLGISSLWFRRRTG